MDFPVSGKQKQEVVMTAIPNRFSRMAKEEWDFERKRIVSLEA
jgi:hypothetical protein